MMTANDLSTEWCLLQNQFDSYEKYSLVIKLAAIIIAAALGIADYNAVVAAAFLLVLWGQDAIWKTFQSRIEMRLLLIEQAIAGEQNQQQHAFQFNSHYQAGSNSGLALILEYCRQAVRPTIAFPHVLLILLVLLELIVFSG